MFEKLSDTDRLVNGAYAEESSSGVSPERAVTLAISVSESGLSPGWAFNWNLGTWFFFDGRPLADKIPGAMMAWADLTPVGADLSSASSAPLMAAATIVLFGGGSFVSAYADKSGEQDWTGTLLMIAVGKLIGTVSLCWGFDAPMMVSPSVEGARYGVAGPMLYTGSFLCIYALVSQGADMAVVMPATQLSVLLPTTLGIVLYKEKVTSTIVSGIAMMLAGAVLLSLQGGEAEKTNESNHSSFGASIGEDAEQHAEHAEQPTSTFLLLLLGAVLGQGLGQVFFIHAAKRCENWKVAMGSNIFSLVLILVFAGVLRLSLCTFNADCRTLSVRPGMVTIVGHIMNAGGMAAYTLMMNMGDAALYSAITTLQVAVPVTLGIAVLGESLDAAQYSGVVLCCVAALVLGGCGGK